MNIDSNPSEIENELKKLGYWDNMYSKNDCFGTGQTILANFAKDIIEKNFIKNMLELGCGQGRDSVFFAKLGCNIVAIDISENAIKFVERIKYDENLKNLQLVISDIQKPLNFQNLKFDMVYSNLSLQFFDLSKLSNIFSNISDVISPGSFFLFSTKKAGDKYYNFGNKISDNAFEYKGITRFFFTKSELETLLEKNFTIISFEEDKHVNPDNTVSVWWKILVKK
jgi:SAM-dependent methyltransferase